MTPHGGIRPGAGRKTGSTKPTARRIGIFVRLSEDELEQARAIGEGNASAGVRKALDGYCTERADLSRSASD
jgi:hypothetical protein